MQNNPYNSAPVDFGYTYNFDSTQQRSFRGFNGLEFVVILLSILLILGSLFWGFWDQSNKNADIQKRFDIENILIPSLGEFYKNSSANENQRFFPKANCSNDLNEVDYEFTLRQHLAGLLPQIENHAYIQPDQFPRDRKGVYSDTWKGRKTTYRCPERLGASSANVQTNNKIYPDFQSCNFARNLGLKNCYIYTSSTSGDAFKIGYLSQQTDCFVIYSSFRGSQPKLEKSC